MLVPTRRITVRPGRPPPRPALVCSLAESMGEPCGLLQPILVTPDLVLVAGLHRLAAARTLEWDEIEVTIVGFDNAKVDALIAASGLCENDVLGFLLEQCEIAENLHRRELSPLERGEQLARLKVIYEKLHPETRADVRGGHAKAAFSANEKISLAPSFADDTAAKVGVTSRTVQQEVQIATAIAPDVKDAIRGTGIAKSKTELLALARETPAAQRDAVAKVRSGEAKSVRAALPAKPASTPGAQTALPGTNVPVLTTVAPVEAESDQDERRAELIASGQTAQGAVGKFFQLPAPGAALSEAPTAAPDETRRGTAEGPPPARGSNASLGRDVGKVRSPGSAGGAAATAGTARATDGTADRGGRTDPDPGSVFDEASIAEDDEDLLAEDVAPDAPTDPEPTELNATQLALLHRGPATLDSVGPSKAVSDVLVILRAAEEQLRARLARVPDVHLAAVVARVEDATVRHIVAVGGLLLPASGGGAVRARAAFEVFQGGKS